MDELLRAHEIPIIQFAELAGLTESEAISLTQGDLEISDELAATLGQIFDLPAKFWIKLEGNYQATLKRVRQAEEIPNNIELSRRFPLREMVKLKWFDPGGSRAETASNLLMFFGIGSAHDFDTTNVFRTAFRKSSTRTACNYALAAWLRKGEIEASMIETGRLDLEGLKANLDRFRSLTLLPPEEFSGQIVSICQAHGVAVVFVPHLPKCHASGAAYRYEGKHVIQLSILYRMNDHFWFSFFHELAHVLLHGPDYSFIDDLRYTSDDAKEKEADSFAADTLIPRYEYQMFISMGRPTKEAIKEFACRIGIEPGIVVGRLQHDDHIPPDRFNDLKQHLTIVE